MNTQATCDKSILICDDNADTLSFMEFLLRRHGYATCCASNFAELLGCLESKNYDLLIQDIRMPGMSGFEVLDELAKRNVTLPVLIATGFDASKYPNYPPIPGVREYIAKPFDNQKLLERIEGMVGAKP